VSGRTLKDARRDYAVAFYEGHSAAWKGQDPEYGDRSLCPYEWEESDPPGYILASGWQAGWDQWADLVQTRRELMVSSLRMEYGGPTELLARMAGALLDLDLYLDLRGGFEHFEPPDNPGPLNEAAERLADLLDAAADWAAMGES